MSESKKKLEEKPKPEVKTEQPDTTHHYPKKEALKDAPTSQNDALGSAAQS